MNFRQLEYLLAVVDHGGFTRAANALGVAQPSLSQAIRALEAELGVELFNRAGRTVRLTVAGEAFLGPCRQVLRDVATARALVDEVVGLRAGHLELVSLPTLAVDPAAGLIGRFRLAHPGVSVRLAEPEDADAVAARVRDGSSELGFTVLPLRSDELVTHALGSQEYVALLPASLAQRFGHRSRLRLGALDRQPVLTTPPGTATRRLLEESFAAVGIELSVAVETDHREALAPLVRAGAGIAILPRPSAEAAASEGVEMRRLSPPVERVVGLIHRPHALSPAAAAFLAIALGSARRPARPAPRRRR